MPESLQPNTASTQRSCLSVPTVVLVLLDEQASIVPPRGHLDNAMHVIVEQQMLAPRESSTVPPDIYMCPTYCLHPLIPVFSYHFIWSPNTSAHSAYVEQILPPEMLILISAAIDHETFLGTICRQVSRSFCNEVDFVFRHRVLLQTVVGWPISYDADPAYDGPVEHE